MKEVSNKEEVFSTIHPLLEELRLRFASDLAALGLTRNNGREIQWRMISGLHSMRFAQIRIIHGRGLIGEVVRIGRPLTSPVMKEEKNDALHDDMIMKVEGLKAAVALPLLQSGSVQGVFLLGRRFLRQYTRQDLDQIQLETVFLSALLLDGS